MASLIGGYDLSKCVNIDQHKANSENNKKGRQAWFNTRFKLVNPDDRDIDGRDIIDVIQPSEKFFHAEWWLNWSPIPARDSKDVQALTWRIHPIVKKWDDEGKPVLYRVDEKTIELWETNIVKEEPTSPLSQPVTLTKQYITYHQSKSPYFFQATFGEVLLQLPADVTKDLKIKYFITECPDFPIYATIGAWQKFHIAVTTVYE